MNRKALIGVFALVFAGLLVLTAVIVTQEPGPVSGPAGESAGLDQDSREQRMLSNAPDRRPESGTDLSGSARDKKPGAAGPEGENLDASGEDGSSQTASGQPTGTGQGQSPYPDDFWEGIDLAANPERLDELIEEFGSLGEAYEAAPPFFREQILVATVVRGDMRSVIEDLLPREGDSAIRAEMLEFTRPEGLFDPENLLSGQRDEDLIALLNQPTATPIGEREWLARMQLAEEIGLDVGLQWARESEQAYPNDPVISVHAAAATLRASRGLGDVPEEEVREAENTLFSFMSEENRGSLSAEDRLEAYSALLYANDSDRVRDLYEQALDEESNAMAREVLVGLLEEILGTT